MEASFKTLTVLIVEYSVLLSYSEDDDSFTFVVDGNRIDNILLPPTVDKLDRGVILREETKVSVDNRLVTLKTHTRSLALCILEGDEVIAFADIIVKTMEDESRPGEEG